MHARGTPVRCPLPFLRGAPKDPAVGESRSVPCAPSEEPAADAAGPLLGRVVAGLRFEELIGAGGMGHVFRAEQLALERTVAVKVLHRNLVADDDARSRFALEARAASRIEHPHVVAIHDLDELEDGRPYLVMEFLRGHSLATALAREGAFPLPRALRVVGQVLAALAEGHAFGIVHRDVKPDNVVLEATRGGADHAKLVDFGLAFWSGRSATEAGDIVCGTPEYVSPEAVRGEAVDARSDLYATGVMLFELLTGQRPFRGASPALTGLRHLTDPAPSLASLAPRGAFPEAVEAIVRRALAKRPGQRYADAHAMGKAVADVLEDLGTGPISASPSTWDSLTCAVCKSPNARRQRHCGHCGRRLSDSPVISTVEPVLARHPEAPRAVTLSSSRLRLRRVVPFVPFVGRETELRDLLDALAEAALGVVARRIEAPPGSGRSTLLDRFVEKAEWLGGRVARLAPDAFQSRVPFFTAQRLADRLQALGDAPLGLELEARRALARDLGSKSVDGLSRAVETMLRAQFSPGSAAPFVLAIDDWDDVDVPSRHLVERVVRACRDVPMLVLIVHRPGGPVAGFEWASVLRLGPLPLEAATAFLRDQGVPFTLAEPLPPLHLEHLARFAYEAPGRVPPRQLGDLLHERLALLERDTRRVFDLVAALPCSADDDLLAAHLPEIHGLAERTALLRELGLVASGALGHRAAHPLIAAVALGSMTLEARRRVYEQSYAVLLERGAPAETLASRAEEAGQVLRALAVLERAGLERQRLGELEAAYDVVTRALALARRELVRAEFEHADAVFVGLALRVARLLIDAGDLTTGAGLLDEAHSFALGRPRDCVLVLAERAHLEAARDDLPRAGVYLREAAALAQTAGDAALLRKLVDLETNLRPAARPTKWLSLPPPRGTASEPTPE